MKEIDVSKTEIVFDSEEKLTESFILTYCNTDWLYKIKSIDFFLKNYNDLKEKFHKTVKMLDGSLIDDGNVKRTLKSEIFFTSYHITEALFALIYSFHKNPKNPWSVLSSYKGVELKEFVKSLDKKMNKEFILKIFFSTTYENFKKFPEILKQNISEDIKFLRKYIPKLSEYFLNNEPYLSYKHGLRTTHGGYEARNNEIVIAHGDYIGYFQKMFDEKKYRLCVRDLNYDKSLRICLKTHSILTNTMYIKKQILKAKSESINQMVFIKLNDDINKYF